MLKKSLKSVFSIFTLYVINVNAINYFYDNSIPREIEKEGIP